MAWEFEGLFDALVPENDCTLMEAYWQSEPTEIRVGRMGYRTKTTKAGDRLEAEVYPLIEGYGLPVADVLATFVEHVAVQVGRHVRSGRVLVTGGGARNRFLVGRMQALAPQVQYVVPDALTIDFKEALIFALLGALYMADLPNCLASVTGASCDNIGGCLYKGNRIR